MERLDISPKGDASVQPQAQAFEALAGFWSLLGRGLTRRCAWCGDRRAYFRGWFRRDDSCQACHHGWRRGDAAFELGATTANIILTFLTILISILVAVIATWPDVPTTLLIAIIGSMAVLGPASGTLSLYRFGRPSIFLGAVPTMMSSRVSATPTSKVGEL